MNEDIHAVDRHRSADASRTITGLLGLGFLVGGIFGLFIHHRMGVQFAGRSGTGLINKSIFEVNRLHSIVMLVLGAVLLLTAGLKAGSLRLVALVAGVACIVFAIYGLLTRDKGGDKFAFNSSDGVLYLVAGALLLLAAYLAHRRHATTTAGRGIRVGARVAPTTGH